MYEITVELKDQKPGGAVYEVLVAEEEEESAHEVELTDSDYQDLTGGQSSPERLIEESFLFLLERERKEAILSEFNLTEIGLYFPEYEEEIRERCA